MGVFTWISSTDLWEFGAYWVLIWPLSCYPTASSWESGRLGILSHSSLSETMFPVFFHGILSGKYFMIISSVHSKINVLVAWGTSVFVCICSGVFAFPDTVCIVGSCTSLVFCKTWPCELVVPCWWSDSSDYPLSLPFTPFWITFLKNTYISPPSSPEKRRFKFSSLSRKESFFLRYFLRPKSIKNSEQKYTSRGCSFWIYVFLCFPFQKKLSLL